MTTDCLPHQVRLMTSDDLPSELSASTQLEARDSAVSGASVADSVGGGIGAPGWALTADVDDVDGLQHTSFVTQVTKPLVTQVTKPLPGALTAAVDVPAVAESHEPEGLVSHGLQGLVSLGPEGLAAAAAITATAAGGGGKSAAAAAGLALSSGVCALGGVTSIAAAALPLKVSRQLMLLRDFLPKGRDDRAANQVMASRESEKLEKLNTARGLTSWGCMCAGHLSGNSFALPCAACDRWFHARCERLDYGRDDLVRMRDKRLYMCIQCESKRLQEQGYHSDAGRFVWSCRFCSRAFEDESSATVHGKRCASPPQPADCLPHCMLIASLIACRCANHPNKLIKREWSCPCNGDLDRSGSSASKGAIVGADADGAAPKAGSKRGLSSSSSSSSSAAAPPPSTAAAASAASAASAAAAGGAGGAGGGGCGARQCESCAKWFHKGCKQRARAAWENGHNKPSMCLRCERGGKQVAHRTFSDEAADEALDSKLLAAARASRRAKLVAEQV